MAGGDRYLKWQADVLSELRAIRALLEGDDEPVPACPHCEERSEDKLEDTSTTAGQRTTCLSCGKSFGAEEVSGG